MGEWWSGSEIYMYIDKNEYDKYYGKEHAYCVMNHTYEIDWLIGWMICERIHLLGVSFHCFHIGTLLLKRFFCNRIVKPTRRRSSSTSPLWDGRGSSPNLYSLKDLSIKTRR